MGENGITQDLLREHFEYRDGHLWWVKPTVRGVEVGQQFGTNHNQGYRHGSLKDKRYLEHRLIWLYHYGVWPKGHIDHINNIRDDNRIENLREATRQQNMFNRKSYGKTSKYKGVSWDKPGKKWRAQYSYQGKVYYLGLHETEEEAAKAYDKATEHLHKEYANYGQSPRS